MSLDFISRGSNKKITNFDQAGNVDQRLQFNEFTDHQNKLAKLTAYDWNNQQSALKDLIPERYSRLTETHYECAAHFVNVVSNYWFNYVRPQIATAVQMNQLKHAVTVAGIDGRNNGVSGGGGRGGNGNGKKQQVRTHPRGGNGKQQQQQPRQQ